MSVRDYITGKIRFPPGPPSSCGEDDVLMIENVDLQFGDDEELKFGDGPDAVMAWDGTDLTLDVAVGSVVLTSTHGAITGEEHSLDIISTATLSSSSDSLVGLNVAVTPSGTAGNWAAAIFGKVTEVAAAPGPIGGYFCAAEFEVNITGTQPTAYGVLVLNSNADNETYGAFEGYIWLREYGSKAVRSLFNFMDHSRATESNTAIVSVTGSKPFDTAIRCSIGAAGTTGLWLLASSVGPADADIDFKMLGSTANNYVEWDASADRLNVVVAGRTVTDEEHAVDVSYVGTLSDSDAVVGVNVAMAPAGTLGQWASAFYGKVTLTSGAVIGYSCGAELEVIHTGSWTQSDYAILVLNDNNSAGGAEFVGANRAYIWLRDYGTRDMNNLLRFVDGTRASASDTVILSQSVFAPFDTAIRCMFGTTAMWLMASTVGPATLDDMTGGSQVLRCNFPLATWSTTYGTRHYGGSSQYSAIFSAVASAETGVSCTATGGANAVFHGIIEDAGIKTNANDDLCILSGRINATVAQTLGDWHGAHFYLRNSDQALTNYVHGVGVKFYIGSGATSQRLRGFWFDVLEQSSSPPARDWIMCGGQMTLTVSSTGCITGFYFNNNSSGINNNVYGVWLRGLAMYGLNMGGMTLEPTAGAMQINLANLGAGDDVGIMTGHGAPATVLSGTNINRAKGTLYIDTSNGRLYINTGTAGGAAWQYFDSVT